MNQLAVSRIKTLRHASKKDLANNLSWLLPCFLRGHKSNDPPPTEHASCVWPTFDKVREVTVFLKCNWCDVLQPPMSALETMRWKVSAYVLLWPPCVCARACVFSVSPCWSVTGRPWIPPPQCLRLCFSLRLVSAWLCFAYLQCVVLLWCVVLNCLCWCFMVSWVFISVLTSLFFLSSVSLFIFLLHSVYHCYYRNVLYIVCEGL